MRASVVFGSSFCALLACGSRSEGVPSSGSASPHAASASAPRSSASVAATPSVVPGVGSATGASPTLSPDEFCARAVKVGDTNMEKCAESEKANVPAMANVKSLSAAKKECEMRVTSPKVAFHGDAAHRCIEAAEKRGGKTTFFTFHEIPACHGVLTGKATDGQPAIFAEECAPGSSMLKNRCVKPVAKNGACEDYPGGLLGTPDEHPRCEDGLGCFMTRYSADGFPAEFNCLPPQPIDARCKLDLNACAEGSSCYQGRCRARADAGGQCMSPPDCLPAFSCEIKGGVFGTCVARSTALETCGAPAR